MKILSSFTLPRVVANLYEFLSSAEHKGQYFEEGLEPNSCLAPLTSIVEKNILCSSKYHPLCSAEERNSYRFATT